MARVLLIALVAAVLAASAGATTSPSGLRGLVMRGPTGPVCVAEQPCNAPATGVTLLFTSDGHIVGRAITNAKGWYRVALRPGTCSVGIGTGIGTAQQAGRRLSPAHAAVGSHVYRRVDFSIDTGIR